MTLIGSSLLTHTLINDMLMFHFSGGPSPHDNNTLNRPRADLGGSGMVHKNAHGHPHGPVGPHTGNHNNYVPPPPSGYPMYEAPNSKGRTINLLNRTLFNAKE